MNTSTLTSVQFKTEVEDRCLDLLKKQDMCAGEIADLTGFMLNSIRPALSRLVQKNKVYQTKERTDYLAREQKNLGVTKTSSSKYTLWRSGQGELF